VAAHAALDALAMAHGTAAPPNLLVQATTAPAEDVLPDPATQNPFPAVVDMNAAAAEVQATDLLTIVRVKLNRVAVEFGIDYALVRDFFVSHL
jgi:hypothetical protein